MRVSRSASISSSGALIFDSNKPETWRSFVGKDELIHSNGKAYAVTKIWGTRTAEAIDLLLMKFAEHRISYRESRA